MGIVDEGVGERTWKCKEEHLKGVKVLQRARSQKCKRCYRVGVLVRENE